MADYTDHDERASLVTQQELDRVALTKQKKEANECMYCRRQAIRTNLAHRSVGFTMRRNSQNEPRPDYQPD
jgi:hypothetical protein